MRRSSDHLMFITGIPMPVRRPLVNKGPGLLDRCQRFWCITSFCGFMWYVNCPNAGEIIINMQKQTHESNRDSFNHNKTIQNETVQIFYGTCCNSYVSPRSCLYFPACAVADCRACPNGADTSCSKCNGGFTVVNDSVCLGKSTKNRPIVTQNRIILMAMISQTSIACIVWASCQIRKISGCAYAGSAEMFSPSPRVR